MQKLFFILISFLFINAATAATTDTLRLYVNKSGKIVDNKDSADFFRVIAPPDTSIDRDLYRVYDYYPDGKPKMMGTSLSANARLVLDGSCINFFRNGKRQSVIGLKNGQPVGPATYYYPNGKLYAILKFDDNRGYSYDYYNGYVLQYEKYDAKIIELRDTTGQILAVKGKGHVLLFDPDFKEVLAEGDIKNNKKDGEWKGTIKDTAQFKCIFHNGNLKSGITYTRSGRRYTFTKIDVQPVFSDGTDGFYLFIKKNLHYPAAARVHRARGIVRVKFFVETDGTLSDIKVVNSIVNSLDDEAVRVIKLSPPWIPGAQYGIPVRLPYTADVSFYNVE